MNKTITQAGKILLQKRSALILSVVIALVLTLAKAAASFFTHSMGILASALDSLMDLLVSSINLYALIKADQPADKGHPYGHGKAEHIAGLFQGFLMSLSVIYLVSESVTRFYKGYILKDFEVGFGVMMFSMAVTLCLVLRLVWVAKKSSSLILKTETLHYSSDFLTNGGVILALFLVRWTGWIVWDLVISLLIGVYLAVAIFKIARQSITELMDHEAPRTLQTEIRNFVLNFHPRIVNIHDFRARRVGGQTFAEFHIVITKEENFRRAHDLTESLMAALKSQFPGLEVYVHYDPDGVWEPKQGELPD